MSSAPESEPPVPSPRAVFISIPRNGSHSVREALGLGPNRDVDTLDSAVVHENHQRGAVLAQRYSLDDSFVFCLGRDPYARCVSWFKFHHDLEPYRSLSFARWVEEGLPHHWSVQNGTDWAATGLSPLLQHAFVDGCRVDYVGSVERFDESLGVIAERLRALGAMVVPPPEGALPSERLNASLPMPTVDQLYNDRTRRIVRELLRADFEYFGYEP